MALYLFCWKDVCLQRNGWHASEAGAPSSETVDRAVVPLRAGFEEGAEAAVGGVLRRGRSRGLPLARFAEGEGAAFVGPGGAELLDEPATLASADDGLAGRGFDAEVVLAFHRYANYSILGSLCKVVWTGLCWLEGGEVRGTRCEVRDASGR